MEGNQGNCQDCVQATLATHLSNGSLNLNDYHETKPTTYYKNVDGTDDVSVIVSQDLSRTHYCDKCFHPTDPTTSGNTELELCDQTIDPAQSCNCKLLEGGNEGNGDLSSIRPKKPRQPLSQQFEKKPKLRTSKDVYDRLKWDSSTIVIRQTVRGEESAVDLATVYVGYKDRFLGMCELQFDEFEPGGDIPFHRVYYFRTGGPPVEPFIGKDGEIKVREDNLPEGAVFIWDRDSRTDLVFKSGNSTFLKC